MNTTSPLARIWSSLDAAIQGRDASDHVWELFDPDDGHAQTVLGYLTSPETSQELIRHGIMLNMIPIDEETWAQYVPMP